MPTNPYFCLKILDSQDLQYHSGIAMTWRMIRTLYTDSGRHGRPIRPVHQFMGRISSEWIATQLNAGNCFDFEYSPQHQDAIWINLYDIANAEENEEEERERDGYMAFLYLRGTWEPDLRLPSTIATEDLHEGIVHFHSGIPRNAAPPLPETVLEFERRLEAKGAWLHRFQLLSSQLESKVVSAPNEWIWKISRYKGKSLNPNHGRGLSDMQLRALIGKEVTALDGVWDVEWIEWQLNQTKCFGPEITIRGGETLRIIAGFGTDHPSHLVFQNTGERWRTALKIPWADDPREIWDVVHEGVLVLRYQ